MFKKIISILFIMFLYNNQTFGFVTSKPVSKKPTADITTSFHYHNPEAIIKSIENDPHAGKKIYQNFCSTCHAENPEIPLGAPKIGNEKDWKIWKKMGIDEMLKLTLNGLGTKMPPRGGCFECSDKLLKEAIIYMLPKEK